MKYPSRQRGSVSVVVPCFNEVEVIAETNRRLNETLMRTQRPYEIIYVDDGSKDDTFAMLETIAAANTNVKLVKLSRNFGQQYASSAGFEAATGDAVVLIDADLQDPPDVIHAMLEQWTKGFDVVYGRRLTRQKESAFKIFTAMVFYRVFNRMADLNIPTDTGDFRLMDSGVVNVIRSMPEHDRFLRGLVTWVGFKQTSVEYHREARFAGETKYPFSKMLRFAFDGIMSFSFKPLRLATYGGSALMLWGLLGCAYVLFSSLLSGQNTLGMPLLFSFLSMMGGFQLLSVGLLGEYVGRIYMQSKRRPLYIVERRVGFSEQADTMPDSYPGVA